MPPSVADILDRTSQVAPAWVVLMVGETPVWAALRGKWYQSRSVGS